MCASSAGSLFHIPIVRERNVDAVLDALTSAGIQILATAADGEVDLDDADDLLARPTAWLFGNEAPRTRRRGGAASRSSGADPDPRPGRESEPGHGGVDLPVRQRAGAVRQS